MKSGAVLRVKKEMPEIDWSTPMPPPSPGDDPLLLSGLTRSKRLAGQSSSPSKSSHAGLMSQSEGDSYDDDTMQLHFDGTNFGDIADTSMADFPPSSDIDAGPPLPMFDLASLPKDGNFDGEWSDSDDDDDMMTGEGEYTGQFKTMIVKTKMDPPTSGTRQRMEGWGRPIR